MLFENHPCEKPKTVLTVITCLTWARVKCENANCEIANFPNGYNAKIYALNFRIIPVTEFRTFAFAIFALYPCPPNIGVVPTIRIVSGIGKFG